MCALNWKYPESKFGTNGEKQTNVQISYLKRELNLNVNFLLLMVASLMISELFLLVLLMECHVTLFHFQLCSLKGK